MTTNFLLDSTDLKIVELYIQDPSIPQTRIAQAVGLKKPAINSRVQKLRDRGILFTGTVVSLDNLRPYTVHRLLIKLPTGSKAEIETATDWFSKFEFVLEVGLLSGNYDLEVHYITFADGDDDDAALDRRTELCDLDILKDASRIRVSKTIISLTEQDHLELLAKS